MQEKEGKHAVHSSCFENQQILEAAETAQMRSYNGQGFGTSDRSLLLHV